MQICYNSFAKEIIESGIRVNKIQEFIGGVMVRKAAVKLFEQKQVRSVWDSEREKWFISIVDVIGVLTESPNPRKYWSVLKTRLKQEGSELTTNCSQLKLAASDGKKYLTDVADVEQLFRLVQSIPSPKAEPFKLWLAQVAKERLDEIDDPEIGIDRLLEYYHRKGYSQNWINQRLKSIEVRKELTDEWEKRGVKKGQEFATLTDIITHAWSGLTAKKYKQLKNLKKESLRDNMTNIELVLNMLAEASTTEISREKHPKSLTENITVAKQGGSVAFVARKKLELKSGKKVVSDINAKNINLLQGIENKNLQRK